MISDFTIYEQLQIHFLEANIEIPLDKLMDLIIPIRELLEDNDIMLNLLINATYPKKEIVKWQK